MYKILKRFEGYAENRIFEVGDEIEFSESRAAEINSKLGDGYIEKLAKTSDEPDDRLSGNPEETEKTE